MTRRNTEVARRNTGLGLRNIGPARLCPEVRPLNIEVGLRNMGLTCRNRKVAFRNMKRPACNKRDWPALIPAFSPGEKEREHATAIQRIHLRVPARHARAARGETYPHTGGIRRAPSPWGRGPG